MNEINEHSELIDGEYYISIDSLDEGLHSNRLKSEIVQIENQIISDGSLTDEEKQNLFNYTTAMLMNVDNIVEFTVSQDPDEYLGNGRTSGLFKKVKKLFKKAVTAVTTMVVTAVTTAVGAVAGFFAGGIPGAIIGGAVGLSVGIEFSFYLSCRNGLSYHICRDCQRAYPNAGIIC